MWLTQTWLTQAWLTQAWLTQAWLTQTWLAQTWITPIWLTQLGIAAKDATGESVANATHVFKNLDLEVWEAKVPTRDVWLKSA